MSWTIIVSPVSGKKQGVAFAEKELVPELKKRGIPHELIITTHHAHAKEVANGRTNIIVVGGDGTINEVLQTCAPKASICVVSQGTMNFFSVCADVASTAVEIADFIQSGSVRPCSLLRVETERGGESLSFEALHIGRMAYNVCQGAGEFRSTLGPMFGILLHLLVGCALPVPQQGNLLIWQPDGTQIRLERQDFYWIIATYRNPYNGVVGNELWLSWMTIDTFPGFARMMKFFEPQMEHFQGTSRVFPYCTKAIRFEFECTGREYEQVALVLDGDAKVDQGRKVVAMHQGQAWNLVASPQPPKSVDTNKIKVGGGPKPSFKPITRDAQAWLKMYPVPRGTHFPNSGAAEEEEKEKEECAVVSGSSKAQSLFPIFLALAAVAYLKKYVRS